MKRFILTSTAVLSMIACQANRDVKSLRPSASIVHGSAVRKSDALAKSVVGLAAQFPDHEALCTGSILDDKTILTAAHCVEGNPQIAVIFGSNVRTTHEIRRADAAVQSPRWINTKRDGDIALIHFSGGLPPGYASVRLVSVGQVLESGAPVELIGYGVSQPAQDKGAGTLRETQSVITGHPQSDLYETDGRTSSVCFGDSGGPGFIYIDGEVLQWGVAHAVLTPECNRTSVHTSVASYLEWIAATKAKLAGHLVEAD